ncbi:MAG: preprotein translocase subunit SecE [Clostridia bacterium]|nr:preprotein translocase subunit SecE [Clostridia bacterium]
MGKGLVSETQSELKKVIWPSGKDVVNGTAAVIAISAIVGACVFVFDFASAELVKFIMNNFAR